MITMFVSSTETKYARYTCFLRLEDNDRASLRLNGMRNDNGMQAFKIIPFDSRKEAEEYAKKLMDAISVNGFTTLLVNWQ